MGPMPGRYKVDVREGVYFTLMNYIICLSTLLPFKEEQKMEKV